MYGGPVALVDRAPLVELVVAAELGLETVVDELALPLPIPIPPIETPKPTPTPVLAPAPDVAASVPLNPGVLAGVAKFTTDVLA